MKSYRISNAPDVHTPRLDEELRAALGAAYLGVSTDGDGVRVHLTDGATVSDEALAEATVLAHDHTQPSSVEAVQTEANARCAAATGAVNAADLVTLLADLAAADTVDDLREQVMALARVVSHLAVAQGFAPAVEDVYGV
ncbi:MAG: hypothetical protein JXB47_12255 [Anaerolineae bacterium]|nr:hypothetical protein [Anaerolineae bacterium]